jgi:hypothetical protein
MKPLLLLTLALGAMNCSNEVTQTSPPDAGSDGGTDADGGVDAPPPDAAPSTEVTIRLMAEYGPWYGAPVLWHTAKGELLEVSATDGYGVARATVPPGSTVTVVRDRDWVASELSTIVGVNPGDVIELGTVEQGYEESETMTVSYPSWPGPFVVWYELSTDCGGLGKDRRMNFPPHCAQGHHDFVILAIDDYWPRAYLAQRDVPFEPDGTITFPNDWRSFDTVDLSISGLSGEFGSFHASHLNRIREVELDHHLWSEFYDPLPKGSAHLLLQRIPDLGAAGFHATGHAWTGQEVTWRRIVPDPSAPLTVDVSIHPPICSGPSFDGTTARWTTTGAGVADMAHATIRYTVAATDNTTGTMGVTWNLYVPGADTEIVLPQLSELTPYAFPGGEYSMYVELTDSDHVSGWDTARLAPERLSSPPAPYTVINSACSLSQLPPQPW